ncbi:MAG: periplasmic heavy metal sensor [Paracoccaceae bacterium]|nr:periplasmic heavy metal sensor [Paracoccaceae bacterium]
MSDDVKETSKGPRWVKIALAVSLSANLLVVGLAFGMFTQVRKGAPPIKAGESAGAYTFALSPRDRREIGKSMADQSKSSGRDRQRVTGEYDRMIAILKAETFDRDAAKQVLGSQFEIANERRLTAEDLLLDRLEQMTLEERIEFSERLLEGVKRRPGPPPRPRN